MNLVKLITDQLSDETLDKLSALLGTDSETAGAAATAAVPTLLSGLGGMASRGEGAKKLSDVLNGIDAGSMGNLAQLLGGDTNGLMQRGSSLLNSLFGDNMISGVANAISRYSGINVDSAKRLLAYLLPMILGKVTAQWRSQGGTIGALTSLFADQKRNIADAIPAGFPLADIPGLSGAGEAVRAATQSPRRAAEPAEAASGSLANWVLPLAVLIVGGLLLWNFLKPRPARECARRTNREERRDDHRDEAGHSRHSAGDARDDSHAGRGPHHRRGEGILDLRDRYVGRDQGCRLGRGRHAEARRVEDKARRHPHDVGQAAGSRPADDPATHRRANGDR